MPKKGEYVRFNNFERKIKSTFMVYVDFENTLVPKDNRKQNPDESYTNKYQKICYLQLWLQISMVMISLVSLLSHA